MKIIDQLEQAAGGKLNSLGHNAYPAPGEAGESKSFRGEYPRLGREPPYTVPAR
jgi:hypothetical protein